MDAIFVVFGTVAVMAVAVISIKKLFKHSPPTELSVVSELAIMPTPISRHPSKRSGWQVRFAGGWHGCDLLGENGDAGKLVRVHLPGGRFHTTTRPPNDIEWVE